MKNEDFCFCLTQMNELLQNFLHLHFAQLWKMSYSIKTAISQYAKLLQYIYFQRLGSLFSNLCHYQRAYHLWSQLIWLKPVKVTCNELIEKFLNVLLWGCVPRRPSLTSAVLVLLSSRCRQDRTAILHCHSRHQPPCHHKDNICSSRRCHSHHCSWKPTAEPAAHRERFSFCWPGARTSFSIQQHFKQPSSTPLEPQPPQFSTYLFASESTASPKPESIKYPPAFSRRRQVWDQPPPLRFSQPECKRCFSFSLRWHGWAGIAACSLSALSSPASEPSPRSCHASPAIFQYDHLRSFPTAKYPFPLINTDDSPTRPFAKQSVREQPSWDPFNQPPGEPFTKLCRQWHCF